MTRATDQILERIAALESELVHLRQQVASSLIQRELPDGNISVMVCRAAEKELGVLLDDVREVVPVVALTPLPETEPWILGSLNLRGESMVVVDTAYRLLQRSHQILETEFIVVCRSEASQLGLLVDEVLDIETTTAACLRHPAPGITFAPYLIGVWQENERTFPLLDARRLLWSSLRDSQHEGTP